MYFGDLKPWKEDMGVAASNLCFILTTGFSSCTSFYISPFSGSDDPSDMASRHILLGKIQNYHALRAPLLPLFFLKTQFREHKATIFQKAISSRFSFPKINYHLFGIRKHVF
jgi:hypothetical protein